MRITFCLTTSGHIPIGGFKVVYEYANGLARRGHQVTVLHPAMDRVDTPVARYPLKLARYAQRLATGSFRPDRWFAVDPKVSLRWVPALATRYVPDADVVVATGWQTAEWIARYPAAKGRRFYLIQGLEDWTTSLARVQSTWRLPLRKVAISAWLAEACRGFGEDCTVIRNGLDFSQFKLVVPPETRDPWRVMTLYHEAAFKGFADGLRALELVRDRIPSLQLTVFGVPPPPQSLPPWATYHRLPPAAELCRLYNEAAIFVASSWSEGWGLPASEAMMCGAALACTDIGGYREFALPGRTALLSPPKDAAALAANVARLVENHGERLALARQGHEHIQQFTWDRAIAGLETLFASG